MINETDIEEFYEQLDEQRKEYEKAVKNKTILNRQADIIRQSIKLQKLMLDLFRT